MIKTFCAQIVVILFLCTVYNYGQFCLEFRKVLAYKVFVNYTQQPYLFCDLPVCVDRDEVDCVRRFDDDCTGPDQWVAGVDEMFRPSTDPLRLQCCSYGPMRFSRPLGETELSPGEFFEGGYQYGDAERTRITGYDLIKNVQKNFGSDVRRRVKRQGSSYTVAVARMNCIPPPPEFVNTVDPYVDTLPDLVTEMINLQIVQPPPPPPPPPPFVGAPGALAAVAAGTGGGVCFAADTIVTTPGGKVKVQDLKIGDYALSLEVGKVVFEPVTAFWHYLPDQEANFIRVSTGNAQDLLLSDYHYIHVVSCEELEFRSQLLTVHDQIVYAKGSPDLQIDKHCLLTITDQKIKPKITKILALTKERRRGIYAPMTANGRIVADDVLASCYSVVANPYLLKNLMSWSHRLEDAVHWLMSGWRSEDDNLVGLPLLLKYGLDMLDRIIIFSKIV